MGDGYGSQMLIGLKEGEGCGMTRRWPGHQCERREGRRMN